MIKYMCDICGNDTKTPTRDLMVASVRPGVTRYIEIKVQRENPKQPMKAIDTDICLKCIVELIKESMITEQQKP